MTLFDAIINKHAVKRKITSKINDAIKATVSTYSMSKMRVLDKVCNGTSMDYFTSGMVVGCSHTDKSSKK